MNDLAKDSQRSEDEREAHRLAVEKDDIQYPLDVLDYPRVLGRIDLLSALFLLKERAIYSRITESVVPHTVEPGLYDIFPCVRSYHRYLKDQNAKKVLGVKSISIQRERNLKAQADTREFKLGLLRGTVLKKEVVDLTWSDMAKRVQTKILSVRSRLRWDIEGKTEDEILELMDERIHEALEELKINPTSLPPDPMQELCKKILAPVFAMCDDKKTRSVEEVKEEIHAVIHALDPKLIMQLPVKAGQ